MKKWEKNYILTVIIIEIMIIICGKIITPYEDKDVVDNIVKELILVCDNTCYINLLYYLSGSGLEAGNAKDKNM